MAATGSFVWSLGPWATVGIWGGLGGVVLSEEVCP